MYRHVIPQNVSDNGDFFNGAVKKRNLYEAAAIFTIACLIIKFALFAVPFMVKTILFLVIACLPTVLALVGVADQSLFEWIGTMTRYWKTRDVLPYSLHTDADDIMLNEKEAKAKEKEERKALKQARKRKTAINSDGEPTDLAESKGERRSSRKEDRYIAKPRGFKKVWVYIVLNIITLGIYNLFWICKTTGTLNERMPEEQQYGKVAQLLLCMFVPFYMFVWIYKTSKRIQDYSFKLKTGNSDLALVCLLLSIFGFAIISYALMQHQINVNLLADRGEESSLPVSRTPRRVDADEPRRKEKIKRREEKQKPKKTKKSSRKRNKYEADFDEDFF